MLSRLLCLEPAQLRRVRPFFALYFVLFAALTLMDGLSLTLFVQNAGAELLPRYYAFSSVAVLLVVCAYLRGADRWSSDGLFRLILWGPLLLLGAVWVAIVLCAADKSWLGWLFIGREVAFAMILLHFGTYLQEYFTRAELNRVMPVIYAGGRVGGIGGGLLLEHLTYVFDPLHLLLVAAGLLACGLLLVRLVPRWLPLAEEPDATSLAGDTATHGADEVAATHSMSGFLRFVWLHPLMFWITLTTIVFFCCRTFLTFRYSLFFETAFASDLEMARFLGRYTQLALVGSLLLQLLFINRWIGWVGLGGAHLTYALLLFGGALLGSGEMTLATAVFARLVEGELRYCLRNPVAQMIVNQFSKPLRLRARAWSLGLLIPLSTLVASAGLGWLHGGEFASWIAWITALLGLGYLLASLRLVRGLRLTTPASPVPVSDRHRDTSHAAPLELAPAALSAK